MNQYSKFERHDVEGFNDVFARDHHEEQKERLLDALSVRKGGAMAHCGNVNWITIALAALVVGLVIYAYLT